jgi:hypothetical protein
MEMHTLELEEMRTLKSCLGSTRPASQYWPLPCCAFMEALPNTAPASFFGHQECFDLTNLSNSSESSHLGSRVEVHVFP